MVKPGSDLADASEFKEVKHYKQSEKARLRNGKAQAAWFSRQRKKAPKKAGHDVEESLSDLKAQRAALEARRAALSAERQTWLVSNSLVLHSLGAWIPAAEGLVVALDDPLKVAVAKVPSISNALLDVIYSVICQSFSICGFSLLTKSEVDLWSVEQATVIVRER
ncbi:hypothetical protein WJX73_000040 [Symbiochloris irregularis]|uniref:BZIP domain-containing protein n=1 Tax=Symbiochloris irregularis TaxID=706552 RepID=A0AAW1PWR1_9CHLO